jgi:acyl dehydratase
VEPTHAPDRTTAPASHARCSRDREQGLDDLRRRIGVEITDTLEPWCHEATRDGIRHYAHGIGDDNPLWCDPEYAKGTAWGDVIAPPSFLFATSRIISGYVGGLPGVHAMWAGADWTWHRPVRRNDAITARAWLKDLVEHQTAFAGRAIQQIYHVDFYNSAASWSRRRIAGASAPTATWRASTAPVHGGEGQAAQALRTRSWPMCTGSMRARTCAAPSRATGARCATETGCPRWRRAR